MNRFSWKIVFCAVPVLLSLVIVGFAYFTYLQGGGGFKMGVDLAGGTDLIYEVDLDKFPDGKLPDDYTGEQLAASLKRRIDPADLYNVTIRPVGRTRVEIILPTGGKHQVEAEDKTWNELLDQVSKEWPPQKYTVPLGRTTELIALVNEQYPNVPITDPKDHAGIKDFINQNYKESPPGTDKEAQEAKWKKLLEEVAKKWPPQRYEVSRGRLQDLVNRVHSQHEDAPAQKITEFVDEHYKVSRKKRHLTSEQVQEVKELISRVGSLEFRILANNQDDGPAIEAAKKYFVDAAKNPQIKGDIETAAIGGKPPPGPINSDGTHLFPVANDPGVLHSYSWVELGMKERKDLSLSNVFGRDPKAPWWAQVEEARKKGEAISVPPNVSSGDILLYSRSTDLNPRLPEKEANKRFEYFVLTRDAEKGKEITGDLLADAGEDTYSFPELKVRFRFKDEGARRFGELTTKNKPDSKSEAAFRRRLAVILDGKIESAPGLKDVITESGVIEGGFTKDEVDRLVKILKAGAPGQPQTTTCQ